MAQQNSLCRHCQSENQETFSGEIALHFGGLEGLDKPIVWVFQDVLVCLTCGDSQFAVPERELEVLRTGTPVRGTVIGLPSKSHGGKNRG
jgi:hypothetical protein